MITAILESPRKAQVLIAALLIAVVALAIVLGLKDDSSTTSAPPAAPTAPASPLSVKTTVPADGPVSGCTGDDTTEFKLFKKNGQAQAKLFVNRNETTGLTCGYVWMVGSRGSQVQQSIKLELCDGPCYGEAFRGSSATTAVDELATESVFVKVNNGLSFKVEVVTPEGKVLRVHRGPYLGE